MRPRELVVVVGWFLLAGYVMFRCFTTEGVDYDTLFAAWLGGVASLGCVWIYRSHRRRVT